MNVYRIKADLKIAKKALEGENEEQSYCIDVASFLTQQTIEKSLKYMLHDVHGVDDTTRKFKIHNLVTLFKQLKEKDQKFTDKYNDLWEMAADISKWEANSRYESLLCSTKTEVERALRIAERLCNDVVEIEENKMRLSTESEDDAGPRP